MKKHLFLSCLITLTIVLLNQFGIASAASVAIVNYSFEDPALSPNGWDFDINGWDESDDTTNVSVTSSWNPATSIYGFSDPIPDGQQVGSIFKVGWITQQLSETLAANTKYTLTVYVGRLNYNLAPQGFVGLGVTPPPDPSQYSWTGSVLADYSLSNLSLDYGEFGVATVTYETPADSSNIGENLWIYLVNTSGNGSCQIAFDNVTLSATAIPIPAAALLFGSSLIGIMGIRKKYRN